ncbi:MAG TPA: hypothetical protein VF343_04460 [Syntrophales bacterium]
MMINYTCGFSLSAFVSIAPLDSAKLGVAKESVNEADGSRRLVRVGPVGVLRITDGRNVLDPEGVTAVNAKGESRVQTFDVLISPWITATHASQIIRTSC